MTKVWIILKMELIDSHNKTIYIELIVSTVGNLLCTLLSQCCIRLLTFWTFNSMFYVILGEKLVNRCQLSKRKVETFF